MRTLVELREYCNAKPGAYEDLPFGPNALVFKVKGKMFALIRMNADPLELNLKCDPELTELLRGKYAAIIPGYHMSKRHWNTIVLDGSLPDNELSELIDLSYDLVVKGLKKADREGLS